MSILISEYRVRQTQVIQVHHGDITQEDTDAIVNAANSQLSHGGGVAGAIVRQGGVVIQEESNEYIRKHGPVPTGQVAVTGAGRLRCKTIIHAVGPVWHGGDQHEEELLRSAVWNSLDAAEKLALKSIAIPAISSGIFGFPKERCAQMMINTAIEFFEYNSVSSLKEIRLTNIDDLTVSLFKKQLKLILNLKTSSDSMA